jgi:ketosteroid isomerase-like protein
MTHTPTDAEISALVEDFRASTGAYLRDDTEEYLRLIQHGAGFTLLAPFGGPATRHADRAPEIRANTGFFRNGEADLESVEVQAWDDTVVIAAIERQHGEVGALPDQDWSLRVTHVYRHGNDGWLLMHRHADPLVRPIDLETLSRIASGVD